MVSASSACSPSSSSSMSSTRAKSLNSVLPSKSQVYTNAVHINVFKDHYEIDQVIDGETVAEVLDYVEFNPKQLVRNVETWVSESIRSGKITSEEGNEFVRNFRSGLYGYTYLEK